MRTQSATPKQIDYIVSLARDAGHEDGRAWLLERIGAPLSGRPDRYLDRRTASELIDELRAEVR